MDENNQEIIQVVDPKDIPYGEQLTLMRLSIESQSQEIRRMAKELKLGESGTNMSIENIVLEVDKNIRQTVELILLLSIESTEREQEIRDEIKELKHEIERLKE